MEGRQLLDHLPRCCQLHLYCIVGYRFLGERGVRGWGYRESGVEGPGVQGEWGRGFGRGGQYNTSVVGWRRCISGGEGMVVRSVHLLRSGRRAGRSVEGQEAL